MTTNRYLEALKRLLRAEMYSVHATRPRSANRNLRLQRARRNDNR